MIFTELRFALLFLGCWISFFAVPRKMRMAVLAVWGMAFYALFAGWFLAVALALTIAALYAVPFVAGLAIVGVLVYVKLTPAIVPLGISYLAFELLHVAIERKRGKLRELSLGKMLAFVFFMPARVAGPIKRFVPFVAMVEAAELSAESVYRGFLRVLLGLAKKYILADLLALTVDESLYVDTMRHAWVIVIAYSFRIFFDFSAYSDLAIGFAQMLGIRLPENFNWPYLAANIREFWERWHITLSQWVRDYVFTPCGRFLFGTRLRPYPAVIATISYLFTFAIVGAWHGLTPAFVLWGVYHGALLAAYHVVNLKMPAAITDRAWYHGRPMRLAGIATTFLFVTIGWVPFFLPMAKAMNFWMLMFGVKR